MASFRIAVTRFVVMHWVGSPMVRKQLVDQPRWNVTTNKCQNCLSHEILSQRSVQEKHSTGSRCRSANKDGCPLTAQLQVLLKDAIKQFIKWRTIHSLLYWNGVPSGSNILRLCNDKMIQVERASDTQQQFFNYSWKFDVIWSLKLSPLCRLWQDDPW